MNNTKEPIENVIPFIKTYNHISPNDLDDIMETLLDMDYLSEKGVEFKHRFWGMLIKE